MLKIPSKDRTRIMILWTETSLASLIVHNALSYFFMVMGLVCAGMYCFSRDRDV